MSDSGSPGGWHPDPGGRHELRYWDGTRWTDHVSDGGVQSTDALGPPPPPPSFTAGPSAIAGNDPARVQHQVAKRAGIDPSSVAFEGGGTVFTEPILVVNQKAKIVEINNEYAVHDGSGQLIGVVRQTGQSAARKVLRVLTSVDQFLTTKLEVCDADGSVLLELVRPAKVFKSTIVVSAPGRGEIGRIVQENMVGKIRFALEAGGQRVGSINAENWRAWNFRIEDEAGTEVARITKTWEGLAKTMFTTADNYVVQLHRQLDDPLRSLVVSAALSVDTALKQDSRGLN
ncbi:MAG: hypothetical protein QOG03_2142 [Actinomycetota bacterium]|jgi:uncharacterized protein YxjI|nr:hypothetical protein [Actinomycetota bacterium]